LAAAHVHVHARTQAGTTEQVALLLEEGFEPTVLNHSGATPASLARSRLVDLRKQLKEVPKVSAMRRDNERDIELCTKRLEHQQTLIAASVQDQTVAEDAAALRGNFRANLGGAGSIKQKVLPVDLARSAAVPHAAVLQAAAAHRPARGGLVADRRVRAVLGSVD
jgi:hypothetical protein